MAPHDTEIIVTITVALVAASLGGYLATRLKLSSMLGFLIAGVALGPFTPGFIADNEIALQLAEIGIILLMFGVGIHFSVRDLLAVQSVALPGAIIQAVLLTVIVAGIVSLWGLGLGAGLLIGLAMAVASTVILVHTLTARNELDSSHGRIAVGWLIVEDLIIVLALVLVPAIDTTPGNPLNNTGDLAVSLLITLGKVALLAGVMIVIGARVIPWLLVQVARTGSRELFTLSVLSSALGIAWTSARVFDVSFALGAFLAGLVISESDMSHQAAAEALPLRDAFAVLFFVSVGMLFDPAILIESPALVMLMLALVVLLKPLLTFVIFSFFGQPARPGLIIGAARGQIGEFSFILGGLGMTLGVLTNDAYNLILATALLSIFLNPFLFRAIEPIESWLRQRPAVHAFLEAGPISGASGLNNDNGSSELEFRGHAVLCGHGRVGSVVGQALERRGFRYIVIEQNRRIVEDLVQRGVTAFYGDASNPALLQYLNLEYARVLVVAVPDPIAARLIVDYAQKVNPQLPIVVRTHNQQQWHDFKQEGIGEAVMGERELAIEMTRYTLRRFGVGSLEIQSMLQGLRGAGQRRGGEDRE